MEAASSVPSRLEDYVGFYGDPFVIPYGFENETKLLEVNKEHKGKSPTDERKPEMATAEAGGDLDWSRYSPPVALKTTPDIKDAVLLKVLQTSIDNIQAKAVKEEQARQLEEEASIASGASSKGAEPYLPIIITTEDDGSSDIQSNENQGKIQLFPELVGNRGSSPVNGFIVFPFQPKKKGRFALTRVLQKISEKEGKRRSFRFGSNRNKTSIEGPSDTNSTSTTSRKTATVECVSCLDDFDKKDMVKVTCHSYCRDCFERLIATAVQNEQQWPPKCCLNQIPFRTILRYVTKDLGKTYKDRAAEWKLPVSERIYCNQPDCSLWIRPDHVNQGLSIGRCANAHWTCTICRGPQHDNSDCPQDRDLALTNALAEDEGWQHCLKCQALVEHLEACQHMTCRCGYQFCYVCNQRWRTCTCTMDQLNAVKAGAATRREERLRRKEEAESELRDALRQIEEFEREEALKAELLRQETERQEEERRQREIEERVRFESLRRHGIEVKYQDLRAMLDQIHDLQEVLVRYQHDKEKEIASQEAFTSTAELEARQQAEHLELAETASRKLAAKEKALATEYSLRVLEEKRTEDAYLELLEDFFANKPKSEARVEELMQNFLKKMDKGWRAWGRWKTDETARYKMKVDEERAIREEVMYSVKIRHGERVESERRELEKRQVAELRWFTLVVAERSRLLAQMETVEIEDGIDSFSTNGSEREVMDEVVAGPS
ncbi:IBR domain-containing protein [Colletotrichum navitas]|uniref:RBR-type E3 ubiquitin transferase n=1 Tax=Colletotrichum navitas TaxID=681940 RepID=A0AAD8QFW0_9PEZI|nr:IBR domain-containing protein [Colletotrichum navitas]KAK1600702.1 IBR domain-containing protein [Colletotrichum navitas]